MPTIRFICSRSMRTHASRVRLHKRLTSTASILMAPHRQAGGGKQSRNIFPGFSPQKCGESRYVPGKSDNPPPGLLGPESLDILPFLPQGQVAERLKALPC